MHPIQEIIRIGQLLHYDPTRNVLRRPQSRDVPLVRRLLQCGGTSLHIQGEITGYRSVLIHGQWLMGQLANEGLGKNKIRRLATRNLELRCGPLETSKECENISDAYNCLPVDCTMNDRSLWTSLWLSAIQVLSQGAYLQSGYCQWDEGYAWIEQELFPLPGLFGYCYYAQPAKSKCQCFAPNEVSFPGGTNWPPGDTMISVDPLYHVY